MLCIQRANSTARLLSELSESGLGLRRECNGMFRRLGMANVSALASNMRHRSTLQCSAAQRSAVCVVGGRGTHLARLDREELMMGMGAQATARVKRVRRRTYFFAALLIMPVNRDAMTAS